MATSKETKDYYKKLYSHLEYQIVDRSEKSYDKFGLPIYIMKCPICLISRGKLRMQSAFLPCQKCGQKGKLMAKGRLVSQETKDKISKANARRNKDRFGTERNLSLIEKKIIHNSRTRMWQFLKGVDKCDSTISLLGLNPQEFKAYLESRFLPGMTWNNYGLKGWHIDHIKPISSFNVKDPIQLKEACHYTNLQPLWAIDNIRKSNKVSL